MIEPRRARRLLRHVVTGRKREPARAAMQASGADAASGMR